MNTLKLSAYKQISDNITMFDRVNNIHRLVDEVMEISSKILNGMA